MLSSATFSLFRVVLAARVRAAHRVCLLSPNAAHCNFINHCKRFFLGEWPGSGARERGKEERLFFLFSLWALFFLSQRAARRAKFSFYWPILSVRSCIDLLGWYFSASSPAHTAPASLSLSLWWCSLSRARRVINLRTASRKHPTWRPPFADSLPGSLSLSQAQREKRDALISQH